MSQSRSNKVKTIRSAGGEADNVFWMSLDEAKRAISDKYEFLAERYERKQPKVLHKHKV
jgi:hypothetical protein